MNKDLLYFYNTKMERLDIRSTQGRTAEIIWMTMMNNRDMANRNSKEY